MSTDIADEPSTSRRVKTGGVRREENVEYINEGADHDPAGSQGVTGDEAVQGERILQREPDIEREPNLHRHRELTIQKNIVRACAVCLVMMFAIFTVRTVDRVMDCDSNDKATMIQAKCDNLTLEIDQLKSELYQLKTAREDMLCVVLSCSSGWQKFGCSCYHRSAEEKTWDESREQCQKTEAHLVIINSEEEQEFVKQLNMANMRWDGASWIGLNKTERGWMWVDGTPITGYWVARHFNERTDSEDMNCAEYLHSKGAWSHLLCSYKRAWICEKSLIEV